MLLAATAAAAGLAAAGPAQADYVLTPRGAGTGAASVSVAPGGTFQLDVVLSSTSGTDRHDSAIYQLAFSAPGLVEQSYAWAAPYATGTVTDDSTPNASDVGDGRPRTATTITAGTFDGPAGAVDVEFSNTAGSPDTFDPATFGSGTLTTLTLRVPAGYAGPGTVTVTAAPDAFANGIVTIPTSAGPTFTITIPEPGGAVTLAAAAAGLLARRRRLLRV